jgi:hypothetical protein
LVWHVSLTWPEALIATLHLLRLMTNASGHVRLIATLHLLRPMTNASGHVRLIATLHLLRPIEAFVIGLRRCSVAIKLTLFYYW